MTSLIYIKFLKNTHITFRLNLLTYQFHNMNELHPILYLYITKPPLKYKLQNANYLPIFNLIIIKMSNLFFQADKNKYQTLIQFSKHVLLTNIFPYI